MFRYVLIAVLLMVGLPFLPGYLERKGLVPASGPVAGASTPETNDGQDASGRAHRIARSGNGHYVADARINGHFFEMLVDTGASKVVLPQSVAEEAGIFLKPSAFKVPVRTANGTAYGGAAIIRDLRVGEIRLKNVEAFVMQDQALKTPLLGMAALNQLRRFDFSNDTLLLVQ